MGTPDASLGDDSRRRLAVLGSPIAHSLSPAIHLAAYRVLGLDWTYERIEQSADAVPGFIRGLGAEWRGLSVTAPLKEATARTMHELDDAATLTGACNTVLLDGRRLRGWNTDVEGTVRAFAAAGVATASTGAIVGAGATALSALVAMQRMGVTRVAVSLRTAARAEQLVALGRTLDVVVTPQPLTDPIPAVDVAVSTLPAAADVTPTMAEAPGALLDADYAGSRFAGLVPAPRLIAGEQMLLEQALLQVRVFVGGDVEQQLPDEQLVRSAMRDAIR